VDLRRILLVLLVIAVVLSCSFFLLNYDDSVHYNRIGLTNTSSIEVPVSDGSTNTVVNGGIHLINDTKHDLIVMYFNSEEGNQVAAVELEYIRNEFAANSVQETLGNQTIWHNEENGTYMAFIGNYVTHDNILIICKDPEILEHMIASARYNYFNEETNTTETFNDANQSAVNATTNSSGTATLDSTGTGQAGSTSNVPQGYYWSGQDADYIREYDDANGVHHIDRLHGPNEAIDTVNNKHYTNGVEDTEAYNKDFN
jgi:hypothetical protein